ncbi:MAG: ABC transporter ATP-binding protein [Deltaproteobacteria bacterium]|nr:ABC transporter ATP-binding protein [Deltaproteobacteria bacterium]
MELLIKAQNISRSFGHILALDNLSFEIGRGAKTALLGPNGAGKSTLLKIIAGAMSTDNGSLTVYGEKAKTKMVLPGFLGWLPERAPLNSDLSVLEHLKLTALFRGLDKKRTKSEIDRLVSALNLESKLDRLTGRLSLGSRRQAALAVALMGEPELIILDEPSSSLDPDEVRRLKGLVRELKDETTLIISSHILPEVFSLTKELMIINRGKLISKGKWGDISEKFGVESTPDKAGYPEEIYFKALEAS